MNLKLFSSASVVYTSQKHLLDLWLFMRCVRKLQLNCHSNAVASALAKPLTDTACLINTGPQRCKV